MNLQKDFLLGFLAPIVISFLLMLMTRPWKQGDRILWLVPLVIALVYPVVLWFRLGNHVWPMTDSLDRLIVIVPAICVGIFLLMLFRARFDFYLLIVLLIGALIVLGIRKTNSWSVWTLSIWIACAVIIVSAASKCAARFVKRDDSLFMPILIAGTSFALAGYLCFTGSITLGQSALPFSGAMIALLAISIIRKKSLLNSTMITGIVMIFSIFLMSSLWWTSSSNPTESKLDFIESVFFLILPLIAWMKFSPMLKNWKPTTRTIAITTLAAILAGAVVGRKQYVTMKSLEETNSYYDSEE